MPFEPKLVGDDLLHLDDELALPDDLQELAGQLGEDSQRLAACYPSSLELSAIESGCLETTVGNGNSGEPNSDTNVLPDPVMRQMIWHRGPMVAAAMVLLACGVWSAGEIARQFGFAVNNPAEMTPAVSTSKMASDGSGMAGLHLPSGEPLRPLVAEALREAGSMDTNHLTLDHIGLPTSPGMLGAGDSFGGESAAECADFFQDLSAPEQEALLDLLEDESQDYRDLPL